ncbi:hypothetical protein [Ktedonobacter robiniae]|nr:hypothetical protein [Ktedonobacter robiniae]
MSIKTGNVAKPAIPNQREQPATSEQSRWQRMLFSPLWLCLLLALVVRIWLIMRSQGMIDGDEVLVGIQAEHILHGDFSIYFYGQPYMGSLEAYLSAIFVAIMGPSVWSLRAEAIVLSLVLVSLTWWFASLLAEAARLPLSIKRYFTTVATLVAAIPPLYDGVIELRSWGGWIEIYILILLLLISAFRLTSRWSEGASNRELALRWVGIGFIVGLGFWVYPLIVSAVVAAALWILGYAVMLMYRNYQQPHQEARQVLGILLSTLKKLLLALFAIPAALFGFTPALIWGAQHNWENITYILNLGGGILQRRGTIIRVAKAYVTCISPRVVSGAFPAESSSLAALHLPLLILGMICIFGSFALLLASFLWKEPLLAQARSLAALPLLFGTWTAISFATGKNSVYALISCNYDPVGRYATPLALVLPFLYATVFVFILQFFFQLRTRRAAQNGAPVDLQPPSHSRAWLFPGLLFGLFFCSLVLQVFTYQQTNMVSAFESPYCHEAPVSDEPIVHYLENQHIHYAWSTNWIAYRIVYETNSQVIVADAMPFIPPVVNYDRIPANDQAVRHADRPSLIVFVWKKDSHPPLLSALDAAGVTYKAARFSAVSDTDILVVTPLNRTVSPFESKAISSNFASCSY